MSYEQKSSRHDHLTLATKDAKIELTEEQLSRAGGGRKGPGQGEFLKFKFDTVFTTS